MDAINGKTLIEWGFQPSSRFSSMISEANQLVASGAPLDQIRVKLQESLPPPVDTIPMRAEAELYGDFLFDSYDVTCGFESSNYQNVVAHMDALMKVPTIERGAIMPDACPAGAQIGTIPVGGVVAAKDAIHPGFHSADICCSMAISVFKRQEDVGKVLDMAMKASHFGTGGRTDNEPTEFLRSVIAQFPGNPFLKDLERYAVEQFMTQGDGNHFFYVGRLESTGELAIVTHHGSRGLGAQLYKRGMAAAKRHTAIIAPEVPEHNAWIKADSAEGEAYWRALQIIRDWTKHNHFAIHARVALGLGNPIVSQFWNEHNFVFQRSDGLFYHGKGATPSYDGFAEDDSGMTLIPMNMGQPILITRHANDANPKSLGFAPHGAGRNMSRTQHKKRLAEEFGADARGLSQRDQAEILRRETAGLDVRFYTGRPDISELPTAYKNADTVVREIDKWALADVVDRVLPLGSIMAGEPIWERKRR